MELYKFSRLVMHLNSCSMDLVHDIKFLESPLGNIVYIYIYMEEKYIYQVAHFFMWEIFISTLPTFTCEYWYFYGHTHSCHKGAFSLNWRMILIKIAYNGVYHTNILSNWKTKIIHTHFGRRLVINVR